MGFSVGDVITITFSSPTDTPDPSTTAVFSPSLGRTAASWRAGGRELVVRVVDPGGVATGAVDVATGSLRVTVSGVRSASGASDPSSSVTLIVGGSWGAPSPPTIVRAVAVDSGRNVGLDTGDTLTLQFDQAVAPVDVGDTAGVQRLLAFAPPLVPPAQVRGTWGAGGTTLTLALTFPTPAAQRPWLAANVGSLRVSVQPGGRLTSANGESSPSNATALVDGGTWGDAPVVAVVERSSTSVQVTLAPPTTSYNLPVDAFVVQWSSDPAFGRVPSIPPTLAEVLAWDRVTGGGAGDGDGGVVVVGADGAGDGAGASAGTRWLVAGSDEGQGTLVVRVGGDIAARRVAVATVVGGLRPGQTYALRCACTSGPGTLGPVVVTVPSAVTPQPPYLTGVSVPGTVLTTSGGSLVYLFGRQVRG